MIPMPRFRRPRILEPRAAYARWAPTYPPQAHNPLMRAEQVAMEAILAPLSIPRALDVGTGSGRYLPVLARAGARRVVGLDFSWPMLAQNPWKSSVVCAEATGLPFAAEAFDLVLASLMVGDVQALDQWAREMRRVLRPAGRLLYSDFHPSWASADWQRTLQGEDGRAFVVPHHARSIAEHQTTLVESGFTVLDIREPHLHDEQDPEVGAFQRRWGNPPVIVVIHAARSGPPPRSSREPSGKSR